MKTLAQKSKFKKDPFKKMFAMPVYSHCHGITQPAGFQGIQRKAICACDGGCPRCLPIQAELKINPPNDKYEQEADRVAEQIMCMPDNSEELEDEEEKIGLKPLANQITPLIQRKDIEKEEEEEEEKAQIQTKLQENIQSLLIQRTEADSDEEEEEEKKDLIQTKPIMNSRSSLIQPSEKKEEQGEGENVLQAKAKGAFSPDPDFIQRVQGLHGKGQSIPKTLRNYFEPLFSQDFSTVRVHTDSDSAHMTQSINAMSFTLGNNIVFNQGEYAPTHPEGKRLLAHELTHVVQQANNKGKIKNTIQTQKPSPSHLRKRLK